MRPSPPTGDTTGISLPPPPPGTARWRRRLSVPVLAGLAATVVALGVLFVPSPIGVADNADYARLTCQLGLRTAVPKGVSPGEAYVYFGLKHGSPYRYELCQYRSPALEPLRVSSWISGAIPGVRPLDLRVVGVLYAIAFGGAVGLLVSAVPGSDRVRGIVAAVGIVVLADVGLVAWFTSAYSEPLGYVTLLAVTALLMRLWRAPTPGRLLAATAVGFVLITTKPQYGPLAVILAPAVMVARLPGRRIAGRIPAQLPRAVAGVVLVVAGVIAVNGTPRFIADANRFNAYFYGLLGHSPDVRADLDEFDLPPDLSRYAGRPIWTTTEAMSDPDIVVFREKVNHATLVSFYLRHPDRGLGLAARGFRAGADPQVTYLGNYGYDPDRPPRQRACRLCVVSTLGAWARPAVPLLVPLLWLASLFLGWRQVRQEPDRADRAVGGGLLVVTGVAAVAFGTAAIGEADYEFTKHLYLSSAANFLLAVLLASVAVKRLAGKRLEPDRKASSAESAPTLSGAGVP